MAEEGIYEPLDNLVEPPETTSDRAPSPHRNISNQELQAVLVALARQSINWLQKKL